MAEDAMNQTMQPSGEVGRFEMVDLPSPPADRHRYRRKGIFMIAKLALVLVSQVERFAPATEIPSVESLRDRIPALSSANAGLSAYRVTFLLPSMLPDLSVTLDWRRDTGYAGMLVSTDQLLTPSIFTSGERGYVFDAITPECIELEEAYPRFSVRRNDRGDGISVRFGVTSHDVDANADLRILLEGYKNFTVRTREASGCDLLGVSDTGRSQITAYFSAYDSPCPSRIEIRSTNDGALLIAAVGIELNDNVPFPWPELPNLKGLDPAFDHVRKLQPGNFLDVAATNSIPYLNAAIRHDGLRAHPLVAKLGDVDWAIAKHNLDKYSPSLQSRARSAQLLQRLTEYFR